MPSQLNLLLYLVGWEYVVPGGQQIFWNMISKYTLFQAEFTFLVLYFGLHIFTVHRHTTIKYSPKLAISKSTILLLFGMNASLVIWLLESTGGISAWINEYSFTYLTGRAGHGLLNIITITVGIVLVFTLGVWTQQSEKKMTPILMAIVAIGLQAFVGGFKGRVFILLILFFSPWLLTLRLKFKIFLIIVFGFFSTLYLTTLLRTEGFYSSAPFFLEMLISYFNVYQLHDWIVTSRDSGLFQTFWQLFIKPQQILGLVSKDTDFDISVMLTKEFFPAHWYLEKATQQWPLETELYLNYHGFYLSWIPLLIYSFAMSRLYLAVVIRKNILLLPIFILEFIRIFSMLRGTLIPWDVFVLAVQYPIIYLSVKYCLPNSEARHSSHSITKEQVYVPSQKSQQLV
jgi:hypothetical protein